MLFPSSNVSNHTTASSRSQRGTWRLFLGLGCAFFLFDMVSSAVLRTRAPAGPTKPGGQTETKNKPPTKEQVSGFISGLNTEVTNMSGYMDTLGKAGLKPEVYFQAAKNGLTSEKNQNDFRAKLAQVASASKLNSEILGLINQITDILKGISKSVTPTVANAASVNIGSIRTVAKGKNAELIKQAKAAVGLPP